MNRRRIYLVVELIILAVIVVGAILYYGGFLWTEEAKPLKGDLFVNALGFNGTDWDPINVQVSVDNNAYGTPFRYSVVRFTVHVVQVPSLSSNNYSFAEWDSGLKNLSRIVSLDFDYGDLTITAYYSVAEHPSIYTYESSFENGLTTWTGKLVTDGADPATNNSVMRTGTASCRLQTNPTLSPACSIIFETISTMDDVYARAYVNIPEGITSLQTNDRFYLIRIVYGSSENLLASIGIRRNGTDPARWCLICAKNASSTGIPKYGQAVNASALANTWTCVELHWNKTGNIVEAWINGENQITTIATPGGMLAASNIEFGIYKKGDDGLPPPTGMYTVTAFFDDCIIDDKQVGL